MSGLFGSVDILTGEVAEFGKGDVVVLEAVGNDGLAELGVDGDARAGIVEAFVVGYCPFEDLGGKIN
jgi:hypothetical protein